MYFNIILLVSSSIFKAYHIILYDMSCDHSHMPLHCSRNKRKRKIKSRKIDKKKRKSK